MLHFQGQAVSAQEPSCFFKSKGRFVKNYNKNNSKGFKKIIFIVFMFC